MLKLMRRLGNVYTEWLKNHPLKVQSIQTAALLGTGDFISQSLVEKGPYDVPRTVRFTVIGLTLGPTLLLWYKTLDHVVGKSSYPVLKKVALDQIVAAPSLLFIIQTAVCLTQGKNIEETKQKLKQDYLEILLTNYKVWPLVQVINFSVVPLDYRVLFTQFVAIFWNTYLSYKTHAEITQLK